MRIIHYFLILSLVLNPFVFLTKNAYAEKSILVGATSKVSEQTDFEKYAESLKERVEIFEQVCIKKSAQKAYTSYRNEKSETYESRLLIQDDKAVTTGQDVKAGVLPVHCGEYASSLKIELSIIKNVTDNIEAEKSDAEKNCDSPNCDSYIGENGVKPIDDKTFVSLENELNHAIDNDNSCKEEDKNSGIWDCLGDIGCNLMRSADVPGMIKHHVAPLFSKLTKPKLKEAKNSAQTSSCMDDSGGRNSCLSSLVTGFVTPFITMGGFLTDLAKGAWKGVKYVVTNPGQAAKKVGHWISTAWDWTTGLWNKNASTSHVTAKMTDQELDNYNKDKRPWYEKAFEKVKNIFSMFVSDLIDRIKNDFGCLQWEGTPHTSKCLKPFKGFACSTCDQKMNTICGIMGYVDGQFIQGKLLTGAVKGLSSTIGNVGGKAMSALDGVFAKNFPKLYSASGKAAAMASNVLSKTTSPIRWVFRKAGGALQYVGNASFEKVTQLKNFLANSSAVKTILAYQDKIGAIADKFISSPLSHLNTSVDNFILKQVKPVQVSLKFSKGLTSGTVRFFNPFEHLRKLNSVGDDVEKFMEKLTTFKVSPKAVALTKDARMVYVDETKNAADASVAKEVKGNPKDIVNTMTDKEYLKDAKELDVHLTTTEIDESGIQKMEEQLRAKKIPYTKTKSEIKFKIDKGACK